MANNKFKLTNKQLDLVHQLYCTGNLSGANIGRVKELIKKGVIEKANGNDPINYYSLMLTVKGDNYAVARFGLLEDDKAQE